MSMSKKQSFLSHVRELRSRVIWLVLSYLVLFSFSYIYFDQIYNFIAGPLVFAMGGKGQFIYTGLAEAFFSKLLLSAKAAFIFMIPLIAYHIYQFIAPGLYKHEKKFLIWSVIASPSLFYIGLLFVYNFVMPKAFLFFVSFQENLSEYSVTLQAKISEYISLVSSLILAFGIAFQLPIILLVLVSLSMISVETLRKKRRYSIVLIFIIAGIITPPDVLSQLLLAFPLMALYEITIIIAKRIESGRKDA